MGKKIKILILTANPTDTARIRIDQEARDISDKLEEGLYRDEFELITYQALRPSDLQRRLMKHKPHIVHFSGHGSAVGKATLVLEDASGKSREIKAQQMVELFRFFNDTIRLVVLNACHTELHAQAVAQVIEYAIGTSAPIGDRAAITFSGAFYRALAFGRSIQEAFMLAKSEIELHDIGMSDKYELFVREDVDAGESIIPSMKAAGWSYDTTPQQAGLSHPAVYASAEEEIGPYPLTTREVNVARAGGAVEGDTETVKASDEIHTSPHAVTEIVPYRRVQRRRFPQVAGVAPTLSAPIFIGREESVAAVKGLLQSTRRAEQNFSLTVVQGSPGVGKTALVDAIARDPETLEMFPDGILRTSLGQEPELMHKLAGWGRMLGTDDLLRAPTLDAALVRFSHLICNRQLLLIVDDVLNGADVLPFIRAAVDSRCALLAATQVLKVAEALTGDEKKLYVLPPLSMYHALTLLHYQVPAIVERHPEDGWQLVRSLGCLPLAILVAGRLLKAEASVGLNIVELLNGIREDERLSPEPDPLNGAEGDVLPAVHALLQRSTDALDKLTRECFAFLGAFAPKPATFDVHAMKAVWQVEDPTSVIRKLVGRGLLEPIGGDRFHMDELLVTHARSLLNDNEVSA
jgi:hypothetical protein